MVLLSLCRSTTLGEQEANHNQVYLVFLSVTLGAPYSRWLLTLIFVHFYDIELDPNLCGRAGQM
jgi:hypothetical protein